VTGQHSGLSEERWKQFPLEQQILMIGNEMNRAGKLFAPEHRERLRLTYERVLRLVDLTVAVNERRSLRKELLRWRDLIAAEYIDSAPSLPAHQAAFRCLLQLHPKSASQIQYVLQA
jgi:hypothetical protein